MTQFPWLLLFFRALHVSSLILWAPQYFKACLVSFQSAGVGFYFWQPKSWVPQSMWNGLWCKSFVERGLSKVKVCSGNLSSCLQPICLWGPQPQLLMSCLPARVSGVKLLKHKVSNSSSPLKPQLTCYFIWEVFEEFLPSILGWMCFLCPHSIPCTHFVILLPLPSDLVHCPVTARIPQGLGAPFGVSLCYGPLSPQAWYTAWSVVGPWWMSVEWITQTNMLNIFRATHYTFFGLHFFTAAFYHTEGENLHAIPLLLVDFFSAWIGTKFFYLGAFFRC